MKRIALVLALAAAGCASNDKEPDPLPPRGEGEAHPLNPLTADEITAAVAAVRAELKLPESARFALVALQEPPKAEVLAWKRGTEFRREAFVSVYWNGKLGEAVVDLKRNKVATWRDVPGAQPMILSDEYEAVPEKVKADARWVKAMERRGIQDPANAVLIDTWAPGTATAPGAPAGARLARAISFWKGDAENGYGRPIEGVVATVDLTSGTVLDVTDLGSGVVPKVAQDFAPDRISPARPAAKPLRVEQPEGVSFSVEGWKVAWQGWTFRYAMHPREGLVLYQVAFDGRGILYRASISEMVVPYGEPDQNWIWRNAFDEGEYGLGKLANALEPGKDAPANAAILSEILAGDDGAPMSDAPRSVMIYERDGGLLWKHHDAYTGARHSRRARQLVVGCTVTVGNYDYGLSWIFHQDGILEFQAVLTGILLGKGVDATACEPCVKLAAGQPASGATGALVSEHVYAPNHQHFFSFRLDFDVDGAKNSLLEGNVRSDPRFSPGTFVLDETVLAKESAAVRDLSFATHREWKVFNPSKKNRLGHLPGYLLVPGGNGIPYCTPDSPTRKRAVFLDHHVWATRYNEGEMSAAGSYPNQSAGGQGLPEWIANDESLVNEDVVLWYTLGVTHTPRPEEWPIMNATTTGFRLLPMGFFDANPALGVPNEE